MVRATRWSFRTGFSDIRIADSRHGAVPVPIHLRESRDFSSTRLSRSEDHSKTKLLILTRRRTRPAGLIPKKDLEAIAAILRKASASLGVADEIYSQLCYEGPNLRRWPGFRMLEAPSFPMAHRRPGR